MHNPDFLSLEFILQCEWADIKPGTWVPRGLEPTSEKRCVGGCWNSTVFYLGNCLAPVILPRGVNAVSKRHSLQGVGS